MHLTTFEEYGFFRSWKGHAWEVLERLHEHGWIASPVSKAKSVPLTEEGRRRSRELFEKHFTAARS
jgi:Mn-dependent DtxR family transcriptional regulator